MKRVLTINEWYENMHEAYDGNMSDFRYEYPVKFEEVTGNSEKAIKRISKAGKGYEVRTSTYMSKDELAKVGDAMGLELISYEKSSSIVVAIYENLLDEKINMDDINDSYGFWGTIESGGIKLAKKVENLFFEAINGLMRNYKLSEEEALKVLNSKMGRKAADQIIDGQADSGLLGIEQYYGKSLKKEMDKVLAMDEARDINDPVLLKMRAAMAKRDAAKNAPKEPAKKEMPPAKVAKLRKLQAERAQIMRDMEQEAEMEGGPTADRYGKMLNKIDKEIAKLGGHGENLSEKEIKGKDAGNYVKMAPAGRTIEINDVIYTCLGKGKWEGPDGEKLNWIEISTMASALGNKKVVYEGWFGPFVFNDKMSDDELKSMYDGAIDGYAYHTNGMQYPKSDYKKAYQAIEKILKKRGISVDESAITEARSINKIQKEWNTVSQQMKEMVKSWKESEGNEKKIYLQKLKDLTNKKKDLEKELNIAVKGKDRNTELTASESVEVNEKAEEWVVFLKDGALKMNFHSQHKNQKAAQKELDFLLKNALNTNDNTGMMVRSDWDGAIADGYAFESKDNN